jgi:hypothetical protein
LGQPRFQVQELGLELEERPSLLPVRNRHVVGNFAEAIDRGLVDLSIGHDGESCGGEVGHLEDLESAVGSVKSGLTRDP